MSANIKGQLKSAQVENLAADPANLPDGRVWLNTATSKIKAVISGAAKILITEDGTHTVTNKTVVVANNTVTTAASGNLAATELNAALAELQTDIDSKGTAISDHLADATDAHDASAISNVPAGNLAATDVQNALNELQTDVDTRAVKANNLSDLANAATARSNLGLGNVDNTSDATKNAAAVTLTNKNLSDSTTAIVDNADATKKILFDAGGSTGTTSTITGAQTANRVLTLPDATDTLVGKATSDTLTNKKLSDSTTEIVDAVDATKKIVFDAAGTTATKTTITGSQTADRVLTLPDATTTLLGQDKVTAKGDLLAATGSNAISRLAVGTDGKVLTADSAQATGLNWTTPLTNPMTTQGDIIYGGASGATTRLAVGTKGQVPRVNAGATAPFWADAPNGNRIINGDMRIDQRTVGALNTISTGVYYIDRFLHQRSNGGVTKVQQLTTTPPTGFSHYLAMTVTTADAAVAAGDYEVISHRIEGNNVADLDFGKATAKNITLSFWVKATKTGTSCVTFTNSATNRSYVAEYTISVTNTWEHKVVTIAGDTSGTWLTNTSTGLQVHFALMGGSTFQQAAGSWGTGNVVCSSNQVNHLDSTSNVFQLTGVKLEDGSVYTGWIAPTWQDTLLYCWRYYQKTYDLGVTLATNTTSGAVGVFSITAANTTTFIGNTSFRNEMRAAPTISVWSVAGTASKMTRSDTDVDAGTGAGAQNISTKGFRYMNITTGIAGTAHTFHYAAEAEL